MKKFAISKYFLKHPIAYPFLPCSPALLSRFDIIFILIDRPDEEHDLFLSEHIMNQHSKVKNGPIVNQSRGSSQLRPEEDEEGQTLQYRLKCDPGEEMDLIPHALMRKYIAYARYVVMIN